MLNDFKDSTMLIIAHRISTVLHCDRILCLENGVIVEFDSPKVLMEKENGYFKSIYNKMLQERESFLNQ